MSPDHIAALLMFAAVALGYPVHRHYLTREA